MTYSTDDIHERALQLRREHPTVAMGVSPSYDARLALEDLGQMCGLTLATVQRAAHADLMGIYLGAVANGASAPRIAARVDLRLNGPRGLLDLPPAPSAPAGPSLDAPSAPAGPSLDAIRTLVAQEIKDGLAPIQAAIDQEARDQADGLAAIRAEIHIVAHDAAIAAVRTLPTRTLPARAA